MESSQKQPNHNYLTPEQLIENTRRSKHNWYLNHKDYFKPGGHGYDCIMRRTLCECGREVRRIDLKRHQATKLHEKRMAALTEAC